MTSPPETRPLSTTACLPGPGASATGSPPPCTPTPCTPTPCSPVSVLDRAWDVSPRVSIRPESFGALLYHFGTRRLSFLKDRRLLEVLQGLPTAATARQACLGVGLTDGELATYGTALAQLADTDMIRPRPGPQEQP